MAKLTPCKHEYIYDENCSTCLYNELFKDNSRPDIDTSLDDLHALLDICED